jgi:hypothetical protein
MPMTIITGPTQQKSCKADNQECSRWTALATDYCIRLTPVPGTVSTTTVAGLKGDNNNNNMSKGARFTPMEDLELCKAFIAASEDGTVGADQKCSDFKLKMFELYCKLIDAHNQALGTKYQYRMGHSNYLRFKKISKFTLKYLGVLEAAGDPPSGDNDKVEWLKEIKETFLQRNPDAKNLIENILFCREILEKSPKWRPFEEGNEDQAAKNKNRPTGSKKQKQMKADLEIVKKITGQSKEETTKDKRLHQLQRAQKSFMDQVGGGMSAFATILREQNDTKLLELMSPKTRNVMAKKMFKLKMKKLAQSSVPPHTNNVVELSVASSNDDDASNTGGCEEAMDKASENKEEEEEEDEESSYDENLRKKEKTTGKRKGSVLAYSDSEDDDEDLYN